MKFSFFVMYPFFLFSGFLSLIFSLMLMNLNFSIFIQWDMIFKSYKMSFPLFLDYMSLMFISMVLIISGSIIFYSEYYMEEENFKSRFFFLMMFFVFSMILLIVSPSLIYMLLGWDGLGLISYGLVMYYQNFKSFNASMITALTNRVGDVFILGTISLFFYLGSWNYLNFLEMKNLNMVLTFFLIASMTKSAQIPFSAWLPAAMAAPTPVSSLVHSSTLVTAGVYILLRFFFFLKNQDLLIFLMFISILTMIMSGLSALLEYDMKKIIALSTLSQLGFMMFTLSLELQNLTFFHLITHACFKALLFMCSGIFIHSMKEGQDIRYYGLMDKNYSFSLIIFNSSNLSLCGFPFLSGFFSKDLILELMILKNLNPFIFLLVLFGTFLTVFYSFRLFFFLTLKSKFMFFSVQMNSNFLKIQKSLYILFIFSISLGFMMSKLLLFPYNYIILPKSLKFLIIILCFLSFLLLKMFMKKMFLMKLNKNLMFYLFMMWFLPFLKTDLLKEKSLDFSLKIYKPMNSFIESFMGMKNVNFLFFMSSELTFLMKQMIFLFLFMFFIFLIFFFGLLT